MLRILVLRYVYYNRDNIDRYILCIENYKERFLKIREI